MSREIDGRITMRVSDDGTRCAAECPVLEGDFYARRCGRFGHLASSEGQQWRHPACIAAEQAAASVPSCEGARGLGVLAGLSDEQCAAVVRALSRLADMAEREASIVENEPGWADDARAFRAVAALVKRTP